MFRRLCDPVGMHLLAVVGVLPSLPDARIRKSKLRCLSDGLIGNLPPSLDLNDRYKCARCLTVHEDGPLPLIQARCCGSALMGFTCHEMPWILLVSAGFGILSQSDEFGFCHNPSLQMGMQPEIVVFQIFQQSLKFDKGYQLGIIRL